MSNRLHYLYVLVAASAVGKSALVNKMKAENLWGIVPKYSTRDNRGADDDVVKITDESVSNVENKGVQTEIRYARMKYIQNICGGGKGVVYYKNNNIYGIGIEDILRGLAEYDLAVIISDFHVIRKLREKSELQDRIVVLYIASTVDERELLKRYKSRESIDFNEQSEETMLTINNIQKMCSILSSAVRLKFLSKIEEVLPLLNEQWNNYVPYFDTIKTRSLNIRMLYNRYIDNIVDIDYVLLNFYGLDYMFTQVRNIIAKGTAHRKIKFPPVFMVCAALSSGKATLMEIIGDLGEVNNNIVITPKFAKREHRQTDGRDGMQAIGKNGNFSKYIKSEGDIWEWTFHGGQTKYAVDHSSIRKNITNGKAQIFISNMEQIEKARQYYPDNIVVLYLHATHETATKEHIHKKRKDELLSEIQSSVSDKAGMYSEADIQRIFETDSTVQSKFKRLVDEDNKEIKFVHDEFLKYNYQIDHVLLNTGTREDLVEQMINLINNYSLASVGVIQE